METVAEVSLEPSPEALLFLWIVDPPLLDLDEQARNEKVLQGRERESHTQRQAREQRERERERQRDGERAGFGRLVKFGIGLWYEMRPRILELWGMMPFPSHYKKRPSAGHA